MRVFTRALLVSALSVLSILAAMPASATVARDPGLPVPLQIERHGRFAPPFVIPPEVRPLGKTYGQWSADWWRWAFSIPARRNPLLDKTGRDCGVGQRGHQVFFLGGLYDEPGEDATRDCAVPAGRPLFFPVVNVKNDNTAAPGGTPGDATFRDLRAGAQGVIDGATDLHASLDGRSVRGLDPATSRYRASSPPFWAVAPRVPAEENLWGVGGEYAAPGQAVYPMASDGVYLMLAPLRPGMHELIFGGNLGGEFTITYHLYVR